MYVATATPGSCSVAWGRKVQPWRASSRHCGNPIESALSAEINWPLRVLCPLNPISTPHLIRAHPRPQAVVNVSDCCTAQTGHYVFPSLGG